MTESLKLTTACQAPLPPSEAVLLEGKAMSFNDSQPPGLKEVGDSDSTTSSKRGSEMASVISEVSRANSIDDSSGEEADETEDGKGEEFDEETATRPLDTQSERRRQQDEALKDSTDEAMMSPLAMMKKGAVAAVGGTMVGLGLVMIPLPTPFGAVVASSGMAVLGTEFEGAKKMNDKIIDTSKKTLHSARDRMIRGIESMEDEASELDKSGDSSKNAEANSQEDSDPPPSTVHMNPLERERQDNLRRKKLLEDRRAKKNVVARATGEWLTRNVLPVLKRNQAATTEAESDEGTDENDGGS